MATYVHGKGASVAHGGVSLDPWMKEATASISIETGDTSHFGSGGKTFITGGNDATFAGGGMYDGSVGGIQPHMEAIIATETAGGPSVPITFAPEGLKVGNTALMALSKTTSYEVNPVVSDVVAMSFNMQANGGMSFGAIQFVPTPVSAASNLGASVDNLIATSQGGSVHLHVLDNNNTGNLTGRLQHSADNTTWVDLAVLPVVAPGTDTAFRTAVIAGTMNRYLRFTVTLAGTGTVSVIAAASRN